MKNRLKKVRTGHNSHSPKQTKSRWEKVRRFLPLGFLVGFIGFVPTLASYLTKISADVNPMEANKPFTIAVTLNNGGTFPVEIEEWLIGWDEMQTSKG